MAKRILSLFLCLALMIGMVPAFAFSTGATEVAEKAAANEVIDAAIFYSDLHTKNPDYKTSTISSVFGSAAKTNLDFSTVVCVGDASSDDSSKKYNCDTSEINSAVKTAIDDDAEFLYAWSDHDISTIVDGSTMKNYTGLIYGDGADGIYGTADDSNYYIYAISMSDMTSDTRYNVASTFKSEKLTNFTNDISKLNKDRPLFIASHLPLHDRRDDNQYADEWYGVISAAAELMDIVYLWGHNHTGDESIDQAAYYVAKNGTEKITIKNVGSVSPNFTYINAGYMNDQQWNGNSTRENVYTIVTLYEDKINFTLYDKDGVYDSNSNYALNVDVKRDHAATEPENPGTTPDTPVVPETPSVFDIEVNGNTVGTISGVSAVDANALANADKTLIDAKGYEAFVAYDVTATLPEGEDATATLTFPIPEGWDTNRIVGISVENGTVKEITGTISDNKFSFEVDHFSAKGIALTATNVETNGGNWVTITEPVGGTTTYNYQLDTSGTDVGTSYLIVNNNSSVALDNNGTSGITTTDGVTVSGNNATTTTRDYEWKIDDSYRFYTTINGKDYYLKANANYYIVVVSYDLSLITNKGDATQWKISANNGLYDITAKLTYNRPISGETPVTVHLTSSGITDSNSTVRLYKYIDSTTTGGTDGLYGKLEGDLSYNVPFGTKAEDALKRVKDGIAIKYATKSDYSDINEYADDGEGMTWTLGSNYNGKVPGEYAVTIAYNGKTLGVAKVVVPQKEISSYGELSSSVGNVERGKSLTDVYINVTYNDGTAGQIPVTVDMITAGTFDINTNGKYENLTVSYGGYTFTNFTLNVINVSGDNFPEYPNEGSIRFDKTAQAVGNFSKTGIALVELAMTGVPFTTGNRMDVVVMLDRSSSMDKATVDRIGFTIDATEEFIKSIVINEDGSFNNNRIYVADFLGGNLKQGSQHAFEYNVYTTKEDGNYQVINNQAEFDALIAAIEKGFVGQQSLYGTDYDNSLEVCYNILNESKSDGNKQFCVFMSDGIPNVYRGITADGKETAFDTTSNIVKMFEGTKNNTRVTKAGNNKTVYQYEYYSTKMKADGVTIYTVGLGLENTNSSWSNADATQCLNVGSILLNDISGPANEVTNDTGSALTKKDNYFFNVADGDAAADMKDVFGDISKKILEAATDVEVEDKIGEKYSINFKLPTNVTAEEADGMSEFYIQVVDYVLDADKKRKGNPTVLENFTFNTDGTLKTHIVDGVTCTNCSHVTMNGGTVTGLNGTYFDYKSDSTGEYLNWISDKIGSTELALQYFVHLDNSSDAVGANHEIPAGTYYTNEYANLTYKNYLGNEVTQKFPIPQLTWNGAQVSYVFYLVNEAGLPVNRAGRVVPFAEAVYVTDVHSYAIVWNDLEQAAGLEAIRLAEDYVPSVYELYDNDANYAIHVYEDEDSDNLNNHFVIGGNVTDEYNQKKINPNTTYVFNTKADAHKYSSYGAYIADNASNSTVYLCKGSGTVTSEISVATGVTADNFTQRTYFVKNAAGNYVLPQTFEEGVTYYYISSASYTPVAGETQWKPTAGDSTSGGTIIGGCVYYIDEKNEVYTIVQKNNGTEVHTGFDFHDTTVAFAVVWRPELKEDTVVIDFGLDVVIDVIKNDGMAAGVVGLTATSPDATINGGTYDKVTGRNTLDLTIGDGDSAYKIATASTTDNINEVRFSLDKDNGMKFTEPVDFYYEAGVNFYDENNVLRTTNMYSSVKVIPATTVYYEDEYIDLKTFVKNSTGAFVEDANSGWKSTAATATQDVDRPGEGKIGALYDADNVYGTDSAYDNMSTYSMNNAAKITVTSDIRGEATFTFYGTGFDVIGLTSKDTGTIIVKVVDANGTTVRSTVVDTYYGMNKDGSISINTPDTLFQVPVIKINGLGYGKYTATIIAGYNEFFDNTGTLDESGALTKDGAYDLYLDAIRIYDPTGNLNTEANNAYVADNEGWPSYQELRNKIITAAQYETQKEAQFNNAVFIDSNNGVLSVADYVNYGPNNEVYLANGQTVAFNIDTTDTNIADIQIALKVANGDSVIYSINGKQTTLTSATDMYQSIKDAAESNENHTVTIQNVSSGILSITNIKTTYASDPGAAQGARMFMTRAAVNAVLAELNAEDEIIDDTTSAPETSQPETSEPETSEPEVNEPEEDDTTSSKPDKEEKPGKGEKPDKENKPGKDEKPDKENKPGKEEKPDKEEKPEKNEKPEKPDKGNQAQNNVSAKDTVKTIVKAVANAVAKLLGKLFN